MTFSTFADFLQKLEGISSRLQITETLAQLYKELETAEVVPTSYLLQGQLLPKYQGLEFQVAVKTILKALARVNEPVAQEDGAEANLFGEVDFSAHEKHIEALYKKLGDLGKVAEEQITTAAGSKKHTSVSIEVVYQQLLKIAEDNGEGSQQRKLTGLVQLLQKLDPLSAKFVVRIIMGRLRLGFSDMTMMDALSWAVTGTKDERDALEDAYQTKADIGKLAAVYLQEKNADKRLAALKDYKVEVGVPVIPALCQRLNSAQEIIEKMTDVIAEPKYDGLRVQIHVWTDKTGQKKYRSFTRNLEESSEMFPELATAIKNLDCDSCILDSEGIGFNAETGELLPFQDTIQRKRKHEVAEKAAEVPVRFYVFDLLALNGKDHLRTPLHQRKELLRKLIAGNKIFYFSEGLHTQNAEELKEFHHAQLAAGLEGAVIKQYSSVYQSGRKGWSWVKIKEAEGKTGKLSDTLDVIVMGYYFGRGKRTEFGIGAFLVGVYDPQTEAVLTIAKIGTGLTDETLREMKERCTALMVKEKPSNYQVDKMLLPDVWTRPELVVEVAADELTNSPIHSAKVALRFPRLVKFRDDKSWDEATTLKELAQISIG